MIAAVSLIEDDAVNVVAAMLVSPLMVSYYYQVSSTLVYYYLLHGVCVCFLSIRFYGVYID